MTTHEPDTHTRDKNGHKAGSNALEKTKGGANDAMRRATEAVEQNPLAILVGGLAIGALAGSLIPRSERETQLLSGVGKRLNQTAIAAASAAREAGMEELSDHGVSKDAARQQVRRMLDGVVKAIGSAGEAATGAVVDKAKAATPD